MQSASAKSWSAREVSHQPAFMGRLAISHTGLPCLLNRCPLMIGLNGGSFDLFLCYVGMILVPWGVGVDELV